MRLTLAEQKVYTLTGQNATKSRGAKVMNLDIIEPLIDKIQQRPAPIQWTHVKAHNGTFGNEMADELANAGALLDVIK